jgi:hypothetical protein
VTPSRCNISKHHHHKGKAKQEKPSEDFTDVTDDASVGTVEKEIVGMFIFMYKNVHIA